MPAQQYDYGMIGLGTMGRNLLLNMNDHGYSVAGFDKSSEQVELLKKDAVGRQIFETTNLAEFINVLKLPRVIILLVPAGKIVDEVINELEPLLSEDDLIMDCGNSHFTDTELRNEQLIKSKLHFMGVGISGGEAGARYGPSIMPGGPKNVYERVARMLESISAKANGEPCVKWLGPGAAGHYVKMVHNGIEYGLMQLISEAYHLLKVAGGLKNDELHDVFLKWNKGKLHSYLIGITADIFAQKDDLTHEYLIDMILDSAKQNGTGCWTSEDAMKLQVPLNIIDTAVSMRDLSARTIEREAAHQELDSSGINFKSTKNELVLYLEEALYFSMITTYVQGLTLLQTASREYNYGLNYKDITSIWRGGCIIRASLLEDIRAAFVKQFDLENIILNHTLAQKLKSSQSGIRKAIEVGVAAEIPMPAMMGSLAYFDSYRTSWLPANLIQAQRDYFGAHTYQRNDRDGIFHTEWNQKTR
jgi:6-phosphogluconate dehydrogenase